MKKIKIADVIPNAMRVSPLGKIQVGHFNDSYDLKFSDQKCLNVSGEESKRKKRIQNCERDINLTDKKLRWFFPNLFNPSRPDPRRREKTDLNF